MTETCLLYLDQSEVKQILIAACHSHFPRFDPPAGFVLTPDWFTTKYVSVLIRQSELRLCLKVVKGNEFIWNQIKNVMSPLPISSMHGFLGGGVDCGFKGLEALECEL